MKAIGEVSTIAPGPLLALAIQVFASPLIWCGIILLLTFFGLFLAALSWADLSFVLPVIACGYAVNAALAATLLENALRRGAGLEHSSFASECFLCRGPSNERLVVNLPNEDVRSIHGSHPVELDWRHPVCTRHAPDWDVRLTLRGVFRAVRGFATHGCFSIACQALPSHPSWLLSCGFELRRAADGSHVPDQYGRLSLRVEGAYQP
jgi:hypothetical protein